MIWSGLVDLKSKESRSAGEHRDVARAEIGQRRRYVRAAGKRKNGEGAAPSAIFTALKPFSISSLACCSVIFLLSRCACDQVWVPMVWPAARPVSGFRDDRSRACRSGRTPPWCIRRPALSARRRVVGHGPSSKVSTTSLSVRKSNCLKCWKPKPGPPVVSITTVRLTPSASGLAQADFCCTACGAGAGAAAGGRLGQRGRDLDIVLGGGLAAAGRQRLGLTGGDGLGRGRIGARRGSPEPHSGDHDRRNNTGQHQAQRITHRYNSQRTQDSTALANGALMRTRS